MEKAKNLLLSGRPGVGKTTLVKNLLQALSVSCGGFYTEEIREAGTRVGFSIQTLDGNKGILSHKDIKGKYRVGRYKVNMEDLEKIGVASIEKALDQESLIIIDEIGKMELYSQRFRQAVLKALDSPKPVLATIKAGPSKFVEKIKNRPDVELFDMAEENREELGEIIKKRLKDLGSAAR